MTLDATQENLAFSATRQQDEDSPEFFVDAVGAGRNPASSKPLACSASPDSPFTVQSPPPRPRTFQSPRDDVVISAPPENSGPVEERSFDVACYGLSAANNCTHADNTPSVYTGHLVQSTAEPSRATASQRSVKVTTATSHGKRPLNEPGGSVDRSGRPRMQKRARTEETPRRIDLNFTKPPVPMKLDGVTSPLFFSHKRKPVQLRPLTSTGSEAVETMLRSVRDASDTKTLRLARGTVSSASPARSSSTPGSWSSFDPGCIPSSESLASNQGPHVLQTIGILELLERDDRPTFIVDGQDLSNASPESAFSILWHNQALSVSQVIRHLITGEYEDDSEAKNDFVSFKIWVKNAGTQPGSPDSFLPSFHYGDMDWTCAVLRSRFRVVSASRSAASIARTSPEPQFDREASIDSRVREKTASAPPRTPSDIDMSEASDYFGDAGIVQVVEPQSTVGSDGEDLIPRRGSDVASDIISIPYSQPSFDWTRIPLTPDLPAHIQFARTRDWASTPLGPIEDWSADLRAMANMVMGSPHPAAMYWGPEYIAIYNEAYIPLAGQKHPKMMGQGYKDAWTELWPEISSTFESAWQSGQATMKNDDRLIINRYGFDEEAFFSWSIVPLVGEDGSVVGLYNPAFENTRRKVAERRMLTLREVGEKTALARDVKSFWSQVQQGLEYNKDDIPFVLLYSVSDDSDSDVSSVHSGSLTYSTQLVLEASLGVPHGHRCLASPVDLKTSSEGFAPYMRDLLAQAGSPILLSKEDGTLAEDLMDGFGSQDESAGCHSIVIFPVHPTTGGESVVGFIVLGVNPRRPYDEDYQLFINLLSRQLATSMASVVLFEEEIRRGQKAAQLAALESQELTKQLHLRTQEVQASELRFTRMAEFAPVGMFIANHEGLINYSNDMWWQISRHPRDERVDSWMESVNDEDRPALERAWEGLIKEKVAITQEFRFKCCHEDSGNMIDNWVLMSAYPETDEGSIKQIFGCITNISQQKLAEQIQKHRREEAVELKRQQENFIDITSHEMRNPLSAILQCADEISGALGKYRSTSDYNREAQNLKSALEGCLEAANTITLCASHQKRIVDDILTLSKLDSQLLLVTPIDAQPVAVVQRVLKMFEGELNANGIQLKFQVKNRYLDMGVDWVKLDPSRLMQVLINLMTNAIKFTNSRPERSITITLDASNDISERTDSEISYFPSDVAKDGDLTDKDEWGTGDKLNLHFSVQDTGRGLDEHERKLLFQRFSQTTPRTHVQYGGSGLGLFISRILTELQGGQIGVGSQKGVGSKFSFYIRSRRSGGPADRQAIASAPPLTRAPGSSTTIENRQPKTIKTAQADQKAARNPPSPSDERFDVLIVEDNIVNQKVLQRQLQNLGTNTQVANHGGEALDALKKSRYWIGQEKSGSRISVILMDLEMPVMNGITCARKIRELEQKGTIVSHIPIIAVTAYARPEQIEDAKDAGVDDVISKPFRMPELMPRIEALVNKYPTYQPVAVAA